VSTGRAFTGRGCTARLPVDSGVKNNIRVHGPSTRVTTFDTRVHGRVDTGVILDTRVCPLAVDAGSLSIVEQNSENKRTDRERERV